VAEIEGYTEAGKADFLNEKDCLGGIVDKAGAAGLARFVLDVERDFRAIRCGFREGLLEVAPVLGVVGLEVEFPAVAEWAARNLVGADSYREVLSPLL